MNSIDKYNSYLANKDKVQELKNIINEINNIKLELSETTTLNQYFFFFVMIVFGLIPLLWITEDLFNSLIAPIYLIGFSILLIISFFFCRNISGFKEFHLFFLKVKGIDEKLFKIADKKDIYQDKVNVLLDYVKTLDEHNLRLKKSFNLSDINELSKIKNLSTEERKIIISLADYLNITLKDTNPILLREDHEAKNNEFVNELISFTHNYNHDKSLDENIEAIKGLVDHHSNNKNKITTT